MQTIKQCERNPHYINKIIKFQIWLTILSFSREDQERGNADFGKKEDGQSDEAYFANLSSRIGPTAEIDSKFWA